ncbi:hypothetical protein PYW08_015290 [Mythimna loreyi]|uniref:Uncharacterized protein n=1 Tax=Mythimna loreyi TaxID=667449 RepID=A0ACC2QVA1_9NEOP|nr:hypothetical protein PYW08_015290 [Mythimna loreyi]
MPIVFSAVASDRNIVSNFASCDGNFTEIAEQVLSKLPPCNNKMTYSHGTYLLHYIAEDDYLYFCITDKLCQRSRAFLFLNEIQRRFITSKNTDDFTTTLAAEMYRYSEDYSTIVIRKGELDELNSIGVGCSESLLGEKILYINNPDVISYSTISQVRATPGHISVSGVSPTPEELLSIARPTETISVTSPTAERSVISPYSEKESAQSTSVESRSNSALKSMNTEEIQQNISDVTQEKISDVKLSADCNPVPLNHARISSLAPTKESLPIMSPRIYIVIVGMIILVIAMSIYALGPVSCVIVTGIGIYSLFRSYIGTKDKSE